MWVGGVGSPRRGAAPAPTDDLFARKLRQPSRPPLTPHTFEPRFTRGPLLRSGSDAGEARPAAPTSPRARAHSHEEASRPSATPTRLFTDPLALLGLPAEEPEPTFPLVPEPRWFAHYDVQSLLFDWAPRPRGTAGHTDTLSGTPTPSEDPTGPSDLLLGAPGFVSELGGEGELGLSGLVIPPVPPALPNAAVSVLEEPQNRTSAYSLEHADLGAGYYRKYFYGKGEGRPGRAGGRGGPRTGAEFPYHLQGTQPAPGRAFPSSKGLVRRCRGRGVKVVLWGQLSPPPLPLPAASHASLPSSVYLAPWGWGGSFWFLNPH